jgi:hypothetical protein
LSSAIPSKNRIVVIGGICIFVALMSFFSLASIINGFETSSFAGDRLAYPKLYTTGQDIAFKSWNASFMQGGNNIVAFSSWQSKNENNLIGKVSINASGMIETGPKSQKMYLVFDRSLLKTGILISGDTFGQHSFIRIPEQPTADTRKFSTYYDNGLISMTTVNPTI